MSDMIHYHLTQLYPLPSANRSYETLMERIEAYRAETQYKPLDDIFSESDIILITYGNSLRHPEQAPLQSLHSFASAHLSEVISTIHILPFYPYSSDDGFSVQDFYTVDPDLGTWDDISNLGQDFQLMFDAVLNHMSVQSEWFRKWLKDDPDYLGMFRSEKVDTDLSSITRPRTTPLLTPFVRSDGKMVYVWTTFSSDQADFDVRTPQTLIRLLDILMFYVKQGARTIRLDAIAYLWKEIGLSSIHLPQTHTIIKLMRAILDEVAPQVILITETNVPHQENISYFGDGTDEAQMVYNFSLPPLLFHTLLSGDSSKLGQWISTLRTPSKRTTFFNFTASHDGIGVRPVEGILESEELDAMLTHVEAVGGQVSYKQNSDGSRSPYELNISYVDAIAGVDRPESEQIARFLLSQTIQMTLAGVPAIYIHSLLGSGNDLEGVKNTGQNRSINREKLNRSEIEQSIADKDSFRGRIFSEYMHRLRIRIVQPAFHPNAEQFVINTESSAVLALKRISIDNSQTILAVFNVSGQSQNFTIPIDFVNPVTDRLTDQSFEQTFDLKPYQALWLDISQC